MGREIGKRMIDQTGEKKTRFYLLQRISLAVQRGNAASILSALPGFHVLFVIFNVFFNKCRLT
jgi:hypothetical protein